MLSVLLGGGGGGVLNQDLGTTNIHVAWLFIVTYNVVNIACCMLMLMKDAFSPIVCTLR